MRRIAERLQSGTAALICTEVNRRYFTGFLSSLGFLLISEDNACLYVDARYILAAKNTVKNCEVRLLKDVKSALTEFINENGISEIVCEDGLTVAEVRRIAEMISPVRLSADKELCGAICEMRAFKSDEERQNIIKAQRIAEAAFYDTLGIIKVGVTEREVAAYLEYSMKKRGSEMPSFDTIAVSGKKTAMPHGVPDEKPIECGDFLTLDFGAVYNGYHSDMTRTVAVGEPTDKMRLVYDTVLKAQSAAEKAARPGVTCSSVDRAARSVIEAAGFGKFFTHSTGHGVGLEIHEAPTVSQRCDTVLCPGHVITDEPGIYIDGEFGVRTEDMLFVTENGVINPVKCEKTLIIL